MEANVLAHPRNFGEMSLWGAGTKGKAFLLKCNLNHTPPLLPALPFPPISLWVIVEALTRLHTARRLSFLTPPASFPNSPPNSLRSSLSKCPACYSLSQCLCTDCSLFLKHSSPGIYSSKLATSFWSQMLLSPTSLFNVAAPPPMRPIPHLILFFSVAHYTI